ncbi:MAG: succinate dehydrogenase, cytochrome b556 subunit [Burkholderiaceae bacterium]|jgi:succinate dehydrogenase / fumarate reductase cytochrome b subunit|nr:succinate dehydrogenase, cytochrome b556 subunit [Burkholderiaceae bacterium]
MSEAAQKRPEFRNINALADLPTYRMAPAAWVSILHRVSGALLFVLLPFLVWLLDKSLTSELSYDQFTAAFTAGIWIIPGVLVKLVCLALIWAYLHHLCAGIRHLYMDATHTASKEFGKSSALATLAVSLLLTLLLGTRLFGLW